MWGIFVAWSRPVVCPALMVIALLTGIELAASPDVNRDSTVDVVDVQLAVNLILNPSPVEVAGFGPADGDIDGDGMIDVVDVQTVVNSILGLHNGLMAWGPPVRRVWKDAPVGFQLAASGGTPPYLWSSAQLPVGLTMSPTGLVTGSLAVTGNPNFQVTVTDAASASHTRQIRLLCERLNSAPVAVPDQYQTPEDTVLTVAAPGLLANDTDADLDPLTVWVSSPPVFGTLGALPDGSFVYAPYPDFHGMDYFTYEVSDGQGGSAAASVAITVSPVNDAPVAQGGAFPGTEDTPLTVVAPGVLVNAIDAESDPMVAILAVPPVHGQVLLNLDGSFVYTPAPDFNGTVVFQIRAGDGQSVSAPVLVVLNISPVNDAPVAAPDSFSTPKDTPLVVAAPGVLGNDSDVDSPTLGAVPGNLPSNGTLTLNANGSLTYVPALNYVGSDTFTYTVTDGLLSSASATVTITVTGTASPAVSVPDVTISVVPTPVQAGLPVTVTITVTDTANNIPVYNHIDQVLIDRTLFGIQSVAPAAFASSPSPAVAVYAATLQTTGLGAGIYPFEVAAKNFSPRWKEAVGAMVVYTGTVVNVGGTTPGAHSSIAAGVAAAAPGDIVLVAPGTYPGAFNVGTGKVVLGVSGHAATSVDLALATAPCILSGGAIGGLTFRNSAHGTTRVTNAFLWDCMFRDNINTLGAMPYNSGGAATINGNVAARFVKCTFQDNAKGPLSNYGGGAISTDFAGGATTTCDWCLFLRNESTWGGAIWMDYPNHMFLNKCHFEANRHPSSTSMSFRGSTIAQDRDSCLNAWATTFVGGPTLTTANTGIAIDVDRCAVMVLDGCRVTGFPAATVGSWGGAATVKIERDSVLHAYSTEFTANGGMAVNVSWGDPQGLFRNCLFANNGGAGLGVLTTFLTHISHCTFAGNLGTGCGVSAPHTITDCIFWSNGSSNLTTSASGTVSYSLIGVPSNNSLSTLLAGVINADPLFSPGPQGTFYLHTLSPCVNTGSNERSVILAPHTTHPAESPDIGVSDMGFHYWPLTQRPVRTTTVTAGQIWATIPCGGNQAPPPPLE